MRTVRPALIDAWIQPWTPDIAKAVPQRGRNDHLSRKFRGSSDLSEGVSVERMVDDMAAAGVEFALLSAGPLVPTNVVLECVDRWPDLFAAVVWCDPTVGVVQAQRELESLCRDYPVVGFRLESFLLRREPTDRLFYPMYAKCAELDITLAMQVGGTMPLYPSSTGRPLYVDEIALDFPELRIVAGHIGSPWAAEMIHVAQKHERVYIDTSARLPKQFEPEFKQFLSSYGQDKCLFATDWPVLDFQRPIKQLNDLELSPDIRKKFEVDNAIAAFNLPF